MATAGEKERMEVEVAAILCNLRSILRARDRRRRRRMMRRERGQEETAPVLLSWGRRRRRSPLKNGRDAAASPDTPLVYPDSVPEESDDAAKSASAQEELLREQRVVVANLSQERVDLLKQIEEYKARLQSSRCANENLKQLHKMRQRREQEEHACEMRAQALRHGTSTTPISNPPRPIGLDLNAPADEEAEALERERARVLAAQERYREVQLQQLHKAATTAAARRRRVEILRAKVVSPQASFRMRRVVG